MRPLEFQVRKWSGQRFFYLWWQRTTHYALAPAAPKQSKLRLTMTNASRVSIPRRTAIILGSLGLLLQGCAQGARAPEGPTVEPMGLPRSPYPGESATLRSRLTGTLLAWYRVGDEVQPFELDLGSGLRTMRAGAGRWTGTMLSEPDAQGRFVLGVRQPGVDARQSGLDLLDRSAQRRTLLRTADTLSVFARDLALSFDGGQLAYLRTPPAEAGQAQRGTRVDFQLWLLPTAGPDQTRRLLDGQFVLGGLVGSVLSWFPDNRQLVAVVQGPRGRAAGVPRLSRQEPDAQLVVVDTRGGDYRVIGPGRQVWVSTDGASLLVRPHEMAADSDREATQSQRASASRPLVLLRRPVTADGRIGEPRPLDRVPSEVTAVLAWLNDRYLVYRGHVTPGAPSGLTVGNSPLVGPKRLQAVKVMDTHTGEFLTLLEGVDPRSQVTVR